MADVNIPAYVMPYLMYRRPIPASWTQIGGSFFRFSLLATNANPVLIYEPYTNEFVLLRETYSFDFTSTTTKLTILKTDGSVDTSYLYTNDDNYTWYMYLGLNDSGTYQIYPSKAAPNASSARYNNGYLGHPGALADRAYHYIGLGFTTGQFGSSITGLPLIKKGFVYECTAMSLTVGTSRGVISYSGTNSFLPKHGVTVCGHVQPPVGTSDANTRCWIGGGSSDEYGAYQLSWGTASNYNNQIYANVPVDELGQIYGYSATASPNFRLTSITDIV